MLQYGVTTKEDVFLLLGEPDYMSEGGQQLGYKWSKVKWEYGVLGDGSSSESGKSYLLLISFDACDLVSTVEIMEKKGLYNSPEQILRSEATQLVAPRENALQEIEMDEEYPP